MPDASMNPNDSAPFDPNSEGPFFPDVSSDGGDEFGDQETVPSMDETSWLLEEDASSDDPDFEHTSVHALPDVFAEHPSVVNGAPSGTGPEEEVYEEAVYEDEVYEEDLVGASYVEPETSGHAFSKALIPGSIVLLLSFGGVAGWAFLKHSNEAPAMDPVVAVEEADIEVPEPEPEVELVRPEGAGDEPVGRMSYQRDGAMIPARRYGKAPSVKATVGSPREPGELPPEVVTSKAPSVIEASGSEGMDVADATGLTLDREGTEPLTTEEPSSESGGEDGIDTEFGTYVDSEETSLSEAGDESPESFRAAVMDSAEEAAGESSPTTDGESSVASLSPAFLEDFILDVEPLDEEAIAMLNALEGSEASGAESEVDRAQVPVAPLPLEGGYGSMAWTFAGGLRMPMSAIPAEEESTPDGSVLALETVADAEVPAPAEAQEPAKPMGPALSEDFLPFGFFDDDRASLDIKPDIRSLDVTEHEVPLGDSSVDAPDDNLSLGSSSAEVLSGESATVAAEETQEAAEPIVVTPSAELEVAMLPEPVQTDLVQPEPIQPEPIQLVAALDEPVAIAAESTEFAEVAEVSLETVVLAETETPAVEGALAAADVTAPAEAPVEFPAVDVAEAPEVSIDMNNAHARLDAIFGPTPTEGDPAPAIVAATEPAPAEEPVLAEVPQVSDEFSAPETLAGAEVAPEALDQGAEIEEIEAPETAFVELEAPVVEEPALSQPEIAPPTVAVAEAAPEPEMIVLEAPVEVPIEVLPSLADQVPSPRRGSLLTRVSTAEIWPHRTVPKSKLKGDTFVLTPNVGQVRIVFEGGDTLDGRMHGVGAQKVALDTRLGRLTLDARRVVRFDRLGKNSQRDANGHVSTKGLERVRVQAEGGVFLGHLLSKEGNRVTLLVADGMRVTLESDDIRPAGRQKTVSRIRRPK